MSRNAARAPRNTASNDNVAVSDKGDESKAMAQVRSLLKVVKPDKAMRVFNRTKNDNIKLDKFLSGNYSVPKAFQSEHVNTQIDALINPKNHEHHGLVKIESQRDILNALSEEMIGVELASKTEWLRGFNLNEEQQTKAAESMLKYRNTLAAAIKQVSAWKKVYGE